MSVVENIVGYTTTFFISTIHVPQIIHTYKLKSATEISWGFIFNNMAVGFLSTTYGLLINKPPLYIANAISIVNTSILVFMKYKYKK